MISRAALRLRSSSMGRPSFISAKGFSPSVLAQRFPLRSRPQPVLATSLDPRLKLVNQHNKAAERSSSDKLARKLRKEISVCVLVLHTEHPTMQSASESRTFGPVRTTSKVCSRVKTRFRLGVFGVSCDGRGQGLGSVS